MGRPDRARGPKFQPPPIPKNYKPGPRALAAYAIHKQSCAEYGMMPTHREQYCWEFELYDEGAESDYQPRQVDISWESSLAEPIRTKGEREKKEQA